MTDGKKPMSAMRIAILVIVLAAVAGAIYLRGDRETAPAAAGTTAAAEGPLPKLVDLGADKCVPCKMMAPILDQLETDFAQQFEVEFIDVWKNSEAGRRYGVRAIPTQIFFDAAGNELYRHTGFFAKEQILAKWDELNAGKMQTEP